MKQIRKALLLIVALLFWQAIQNQSNGQENSTRSDGTVSVLDHPIASPFGGSPQFTAAEFWQKTKNLLNNQKGYVTQPMLDREYGVRLKQYFSEPDGASYQLAKDKEWDIGIRLDVRNASYRGVLGYCCKGESSLLNLFLASAPPKPTDLNSCIGYEQVRNDLISMGWVLKSDAVFTEKNPIFIDGRPVLLEFTEPIMSFSGEDNKSYIIVRLSYKKCVVSIVVEAQK